MILVENIGFGFKSSYYLPVILSSDFINNISELPNRLKTF